MGRIIGSESTTQYLGENEVQAFVLVPYLTCARHLETRSEESQNRQ